MGYKKANSISFSTIDVFNSRECQNTLRQHYFVYQFCDRCSNCTKKSCYGYRKSQKQKESLLEKSDPIYQQFFCYHHIYILLKFSVFFNSSLCVYMFVCIYTLAEVSCL